MKGNFNASKKRAEKGNGYVEFSAVLLVLFSIVGAATDFGLSMGLAHSVQSAAREGARMAATLNAPISQTSIESVARSLVPGAEVTFVGPTNSGGLLGTDPVSGTPVPCDQEITVEVKTNYRYGILRLLGYDQREIRRTATMRWERQSLCT